MRQEGRRGGEARILPLGGARRGAPDGRAREAPRRPGRVEVRLRRGVVGEAGLAAEERHGRRLSLFVRKRCLKRAVSGGCDVSNASDVECDRARGWRDCGCGPGAGSVAAFELDERNTRANQITPPAHRWKRTRCDRRATAGPRTSSLKDVEARAAPRARPEPQTPEAKTQDPVRVPGRRGQDTQNPPRVVRAHTHTSFTLSSLAASAARRP